MKLLESLIDKIEVAAGSSAVLVMMRLEWFRVSKPSLRYAPVKMMKHKHLSNF